MKQTSAIMACQVETMPSPDQCGQGFRSTQEKKSPFQNGLVSDKLCAAICCFVIPTTVNMYLDESDQITYLANIIFLAHADGTLSPKVAAALEEVRASVGVTKHIYNLAEKCALSGVYSPTKAGDYAAQVSNMADMLYVAFVDAHISDAEKKLIAEFSRSLNLTEEQTAILTKDAINRLKKKELSLLCPSCKAPITSDSTYCPKCGALLVGNAAASEFSVPPSGYSIEFCDSAAANFRAALKIAQKAPTFLTCVRKKKNWYLASWPASSIGEAAHLAEALSGIRNKKCYRDGLEIEWDELFGFLWCAKERNKAYRPAEYCFGHGDYKINPWGCKQSRLYWTDWAMWFCYGRFEKQGVSQGNQIWVFDKPRIQHELMTNLHRFRFCPFLRMKLIDAVLRVFPDQVEITEKGPWQYRPSNKELPGSIKVVEVQKEDDMEFKDEYFAAGVRPRSGRLFLEILKRSLAEAGITDIKADQIPG